MATTHVPLKGGAYQSHSVIAAAQRCLNLYPETGPTSSTSSGGSASTIGEPSVVAHYPTPGTRLLGSIGTGPIRGIRQCSTGGVYVVSGDTLYSVDVTNWSGTPLGTLTPGIRTPVSMTDNGLDMVVVDGSANGWTVTLATNAFAIINDPNGMFIGADRVDYLDTFFIFNKPGTPQFYISGSLAVTFDSLDFANKAAYSDLLMTTVVCKRLIYLVGERTAEIWYESGETFSTTAGQSASVSEATAVVAFQFAPMQSEVFVDHGTVAKYSPAVYDNYMFWLTRDRRGQGAIHAIAGYESKRISTFAIEQELAGYDRLWDAIGFCYRLGGHAYYVLTFPHADKTWAYDIITGLWHEWGWIDSNGSEHRHRANCYFAVNDLGVVGDWQDGNLYALDHQLFTDNGRPIKRVRAFPHLLSDGKRVFYRQFLADLETGWAPAVPPAISPLPPSTYDLEPIILRTAGTGMTQSGGTTGFPSTPFSYLLFSEWVCLGTQPRSVGVFNNVSFMQVEVNNSSVHVRLLAGVSAPIFDGTYTAPIGNVLSHILVSADPVTQRLQVYHNDLPLTLSSGGWTGSGQFHISPAFNTWNVGGAGSAAPGPGLADLFIGAPASFYDLTVIANRRKFIRADMMPADLGANASSVLGTAPPIYLTVRPGGVANDFAANNGTGGAFTIAAPPLMFQASGSCVLAPAPEPEILPVPKNLISLRWSDDRGHSWSHPVSILIGEAGEYRTSLQWQRLGMGRDRCFELFWDVPMKTALQGAWIDATPAQS